MIEEIVLQYLISLPCPPLSHQCNFLFWKLIKEKQLVQKKDFNVNNSNSDASIISESSSWLKIREFLFPGQSFALFSFIPLSLRQIPN